jgi:heme/copper-type cytochrome/quinol oxidase subunit 3
MIIFLASEVFLFGSLFFTYFYLKINTKPWPPAGVNLDSRLAAINTGILICGSVLVWAASSLVRRGRMAATRAALLGASLLGFVFLGITGWEWLHESFRPWTNAYGSIFFTLTGFHALHVFGGAMLMLALSIRTRRGKYTFATHTGIEVGALYWHYVDFIWILVFTTLFFIR